MRNLLADLPRDRSDELVEQLVGNRHVRIERIVSTGQASPEGFWYDQDWHEWILVLSGEARLRFDDDGPSLHLRAGDSLEISPHRRHRVEWTSPDEPTVWLAVHHPPESDASRGG